MPRLNNKRHFLLLTSDYGFGHRSAANSVAKAMELLHGDEAETVIVNSIIDQPSARILKQSESSYDRTVCSFPGFYRFSYEISNSRKASLLVENTLSLAMVKNMELLLHQIEPAAILNTNHIYNAPMGDAIRKLNLQTPLFTVVTDLADVHSLWFNSNPDGFFVASEAIRNLAVENGIPSDKITISGIPVNPRFAQTHHEKSRLRKEFELDPDLPVILVVGSRRVKGIIEQLHALEQAASSFQVAVITGGNETLYRKLNQSSWNFPIKIKKYVTNVPDWMVCSDILITKAGGLVLSEGLAAGLPIIIIDNLPGQEMGNIDFVTENGAGIMVEPPSELPAVIDNWLSEDKSVYYSYAYNSQRIGRPDSSLVIAEALWQASFKKSSPPEDTVFQLKYAARMIQP